MQEALGNTDQASFEVFTGRQERSRVQTNSASRTSLYLVSPRWASAQTKDDEFSHLSTNRGRDVAHKGMFNDLDGWRNGRLRSNYALPPSIDTRRPPENGRPSCIWQQNVDVCSGSQRKILELCDIFLRVPIWRLRNRPAGDEIRRCQTLNGLLI
jgi:hypothetical protein